MQLPASGDRSYLRGAGAQATVPGFYAWAVTVTPAAWSHGASVVAKVAAVFALGALAFGAIGERRWGAGARIGSLWAFVLACGLAWSAAPAALGSTRVDALLAVAGMLGWGAFALVSAAPGIQGQRVMGRVVSGPPLGPRRRMPRYDVAYVLGGAVLAAALQVIGWSAANPERALLVRLVSLAAGIAIVGAAAEIAVARHFRRAPRSGRVRVYRARLALVLLGLVLFAGALLSFFAGSGAW